MYVYTRIHCARKRGLKGHLPRVNLIELHKWPVGLLLLRKIGFMPQNLSKTMAEICVEMTETSGKMAEISGNFLPLSFACNQKPEKTMRVHIDHLMHVFRSIELCGPNKMLKNSLSSS